MKSKNDYWVRSGTYTLLQRLSAFVFGFGSYFFLVRYLSLEDFGVWTLYVVISTSVEMSRSAFIQNAFVKFFNEEGCNKDELLASSSLLNLITTLVFVSLLLVGIPIMSDFWNTELIGELILWYCFTSIVLMPFSQLNYLEQANHSFKGIFLGSLVRQGLFFLIVVFAFFYSPKLSLSFFAMCQTFCAILGLLTCYWTTKRLLPARLDVNWTLLKRLFKFGKYILGTGITSTIGKNADQIILGSVNHSLVAIYNSGVRVLNMMEIPSLSISSIVYPKLAEASKNDDYSGVSHLYQKSVGTILAFVFPVILFALIFPKFILFITAGEKYMEADNILRVMACASVLVPFNIQSGSAFEVTGNPQVSFYINVVANILNVILNLVLIHMYGAMGAAFAFSTTVLLIFAASQYWLSKQLNINLLAIIKFTFTTYLVVFQKLRGYLK